MQLITKISRAEKGLVLKGRGTKPKLSLRANFSPLGYVN